MTDDDNRFWLPAFDAFEEQLRLLSRAEREPIRNRTRRRGVVGVLAALVVLVPTAFAVGGAFQGDDPTVAWDGESVRVDGELVDCPADQDLVDQVGADPCAMFTPTSPPLSEKVSGDVGVGSAARADNADFVVEWDGETLTVNGDVTDCPSDPALATELGFDPCKMLTPSPAPASESTGSGSRGLGGAGADRPLIPPQD